jgi:hypothetical protein
VAFARWILAAQRRNAPGKRRAAALRYFEQRIAKSKQSRAKALK